MPAGSEYLAVEGSFFTLMVNNIPLSYTAKALLIEIGQHCDLQFCDMLHLPIDAKRRCNIGHAFINFTHKLAAQNFVSAMSGRLWSLAQKQKYCTISVAHIQGRTAHIANFVLNNEKSRLQPPYAPLVFFCGQPVDFEEAARMCCEESVVLHMQQKNAECEEPEVEGAQVVPVSQQNSAESRSQKVRLHSSCRKSRNPSSEERSSSVEVVDKGVPVQAVPLPMGLLSGPQSDVLQARRVAL